MYYTEYRWVKRVLFWIAFGMFFGIMTCVCIEAYNISIEKLDVEAATRLASKDAQTAFQSTGFGTSSEDSYGYSLVFDIKNDAVAKQRYNTYLSTLKSQGISNGVYANDSKFKKNLDELMLSRDEYLNGTVDFVYTPFQYSLTFLEEETLQKRFDETVNQIIDTIYSSTNLSRGILGTHNAFITSTSVEVDGPHLMDLSTAVNQDKQSKAYQSYLHLFGSSNQSALNMTNKSGNNNNSGYDYVVYYNVKYTVSWAHTTKTFFFKNHNLKKVLPQIFNDQGYLVIPMGSITQERAYSVLN